MRVPEGKWEWIVTPEATEEAAREAEHPGFRQLAAWVCFYYAGGRGKKGYVLCAIPCGNVFHNMGPVYTRETAHVIRLHIAAARTAPFRRFLKAGQKRFFRTVEEAREAFQQHQAAKEARRRLGEDEAPQQGGR